jgi:hypothetical protein
VVNGEWKDALRRYMEAVHQCFVDGQYERLFPFYGREEAFAQREREWWERERDKLISRGALPIAVRAKVTPLHIAQVGDHVEAALSWQIELTYRLRGTIAQQEHHRLQKVKLVKQGDEWAFLWPWGWYFDGHQLEQKPDANQEEEEPVQEVKYGGTYNREQAVAYAERYWNSANPAYIRFNDDCTNFISQCVHAGGIPMVYTGRRDKGWWYRGGKKPTWSYSWTVANSFYQLLKSGKPPMHAVQVVSPDLLLPGDVICYDFDGDGRWQHNTMVVAKDANGMPLVNAHTTNSSRRYWEYLDSTAYTPKIRYAFFHIRGS